MTFYKESVKIEITKEVPMSFTSSEKAKTVLRSYLQGKEMFSALEAMEICLKYHNGMRKDGVTPEWHHQFSIVLYLTTLDSTLDSSRRDSYVSEEVYITAFLHDIVEDKNYPLETVNEKFGSRVRDAVELISKTGTFANEINKTNIDYYAAMSNNVIASLVKGADRMHNFQSMTGVFSEEKQEAYILEAETLLLPMLKEARNKFPRYRPAFENIKYVLSMQMMLVTDMLNKGNDK